MRGQWGRGRGAIVLESAPARPSMCSSRLHGRALVMRATDPCSSASGRPRSVIRRNRSSRFPSRLLREHVEEEASPGGIGSCCAAQAAEERHRQSHQRWGFPLPRALTYTAQYCTAFDIQQLLRSCTLALLHSALLHACTPALLRPCSSGDDERQCERERAGRS